MARKAKKWVKKSGIAKHKGALHRALGIPVGQRIPERTLVAATHHPGHIGKMAREAMVLRSFPHHYGPRKKHRKVKHKRGR